MESAILWTRLSNDFAGKASCSRMYFGSLTCELLLPTAEQVEAARDTATRHGKFFSLVTPWLTDSGLKRLLPALSRLDPGDEVIVNDWGLLRRIHRDYPHLIPVAGLLVTRPSRDPRATDKAGSPAAGRVPPSFHPSGSFLDLLRQFGVKRLEICQPHRGFVIGQLPEDLHLSVYLPWSLLTLTRRCPWRTALAPNSLLSTSCPKPCQGRPTHLRNRYDDSTQYMLLWNAWFTEPPPGEPPVGADRIVFLADAGPAGVRQ